MPIISTTLPDRFLSLIKRDKGCWVWQGYVNNSGYGQYGSTKKGQDKIAHRRSYKAFVGDIPRGLQIDHLCKNKLCVNPDHLEAVTPRENLDRAENAPATINRKKTACLRGHTLSGKNLRVHKSGKRECILCKKVRVELKRKEIA